MLDHQIQKKLRPWDGPFLCTSCQEKKEAMEGRRPSILDSLVRVNSELDYMCTTLANNCFGADPKMGSRQDSSWNSSFSVYYKDIDLNPILLNLGPNQDLSLVLRQFNSEDQS